MEQRRPTIDELVDQINARFSSKVYGPEPIARTGRQLRAGSARPLDGAGRTDARRRAPMAQGGSPAGTRTPVVEELPDGYRAARAISRYQTTDQGRGRWLSEAELFHLQGKALEGLSDSYDYHGRFNAYYPTYNDMSDRQLRGYVSWRTRVRSGVIEPSQLSYAYLYLYELIGGIGYDDPLQGFELMRSFWRAYRAFEPGMDRYARVWLHDFVIYHGLDARLLDGSPALERDRRLLDLVRAWLPFDPALSHLLGGAERPESVETVRLPPDAAREEELFSTLSASSTYRIDRSRLYRDHPDDLRHVACAVFARMLGYCRKHRSHGYIEGSFGEPAEMGYTMFASAVFFEERRHPDAVYELDPLCTYSCTDGFWTCRRVYGGRGSSKAFGDLLRAVDQRLRAALRYEPGLREQAVPKYLARIIRQEIDAWLSWKSAHAPREISIDVSKLAGIRSAAAETREALLIDEEREEETPAGGAAPEPEEAAPPAGTDGAESGHGPSPARDGAPHDGGERTPPGLTADEAALLAALAARDDDAARAVARRARESADMLVDAINEKLFDALGDTALEFGPEGPAIVEDYREDVKGLLGL